MTYDRNTVVIPTSNQERIRVLMKIKGVARSAELLGVCRHTLERAAGGLTVQRGSEALLAVKLAERDAAGKVP
jgi:hypothetical protein